jgi:hypothetical protein
MQLLQMHILPMFIFDGKGRPKLKRGKTVRGNAHWIVRDMKAMLDGFGFAWVKVSFGVSDLGCPHACARLPEKPRQNSHG